jgi:hypothetical protein
MVDHLIHGWEDIAVVVTCLVMAYAYPWKPRRYRPKRVPVEERNEHDRDTH